MTPFSALDATARRAIYDLSWVVGVAITAVSAYFTSLGDPLPRWLVGATGAYAAVAAAVSVLARVNATDAEAVTDAKSPTGAVAGPAADIPEGQPVTVEAAKDAL